MARTTAERSAAYRDRRACGIKVVSFEVDFGLLRERLVDAGRMTEAEFADSR